MIIYKIYFYTICIIYGANKNKKKVLLVSQLIILKHLIFI